MKPLVTNCIFCGAKGPLTNEHIYGDWILDGGYVPRTRNKHSINHVSVYQPGGQNQSEQKVKAGDPLNSKVKVVCKPCNNGWMSGIQNDNKSLLIKLFQGQSCVFGELDQEKLSAWVAMVCVTSEYVTRDPTSIAISQDDRDYIMANRKAPPAWRMWIGNYQRHKWMEQWVRTSVPILDAPAHTDARPNTQTTTFVIGKLYVTAISSHDPEHAALWNWAPTPRAHDLLTSIWPTREPIVAWPRETMADKDAQQFSRAFFDTVHAIGRMHGF